MTTNILIVDDHPAIRTTMKDVMENEGFVTEVAESGTKAIDLYKRKKFDFVLMDMQMPEPKEWMHFVKCSSVIVSMQNLFSSAFSSPELENEAHQLGCIEFLQKPIRLKML